MIKATLNRYWPLIKSLQTGLLVFTGLAGYMTVRCPVLNVPTLLAVGGSLFLTISGSTILNMVFDQDIDRKMERTCMRPLPAGSIKPREALILGLTVNTLGLIWAYVLDGLYAAIVFAGLFFDVIIYTILLKRRTAWSVVWGGIAGGMPVLAARSLGVGSIDWIGVALMLTILFWIPTHIMTFNLRYQDDYANAGIPTFPSRYGSRKTQQVIALSSILAAICMGVSAIGIGMSWGALRLLAILSVGLLGFALFVLFRPSMKMNFGLFKFASIYMLGSMMLLMMGAI